MKKITLFVSALLITFSTSIFAQKTWTGTTSTAWNTFNQLVACGRTSLN